jgi:hypothetical protein
MLNYQCERANEKGETIKRDENVAGQRVILSSP